MKKSLPAVALSLFLLALFLVVKGTVVSAQEGESVGDRPALEKHVNQSDIDNNNFKLRELLRIGESIFAARWTKPEGQGRPGATGNGAPTRRELANSVGFTRTSGPDSSSCVDCHNQPTPGGAGGFVANVFVLAQVLDPVIDNVSAEFSNERNTLGMNGSGAIEMLAREMTQDLLSIRNTAKEQAKSSGQIVTLPLTAKGVNFGSIIATPQGGLDTSLVEGVDADLVIKPFHQKGVVNSIRVFTVNAYNHHHGMQAVERFGVGQKDSSGNIITTNDFDQDGVPDELTAGDITAATLFQAAMNIPGRVISSSAARRAAAQRGEALFSTVGCAQCHIPALILNSRNFSEPNPFNPPGNLRPQDVSQPYTFDLTRDIPKPWLERTGTGGAIVRAYTDLKRHVICDFLDPFYCNERVIQSGVPTNQFITRKLWDVGNTSPYGHRGDLTTISEAILHHAGEARPARASFEALTMAQQAEIIEFLNQLQVLPIGSQREITEIELRNATNQVDGKGPK